ncbi:MAG TPA: thiamine phosphate synthase [Sphingomonadaceae bacterium]|nr:thiamine phosphate synthase [Sphingomonadaceae bacterium]
MRRRQPPPRLWLMTDERQGDALWPVLARLPRGAGIVFRHRRTPPAERRALYERVRRIARARGLVLLLAGSPREAIAWKADGAHGPSPHRTAPRMLCRTAAAHDARELIAGTRRRVDLLFLSPVFATRSHPGAAALGVTRFGLLARKTRVPVVALGGMDAARGRRLRALGAFGWAAIDAWNEKPACGADQKRKAVPI